MRKPERFAPPGMELGPWKNYTATVLVLCCLFAIYHFGFEMLHARAKLFDPVTGEQAVVVPEMPGLNITVTNGTNQ